MTYILHLFSDVVGRENKETGPTNGRLSMDIQTQIILTKNYFKLRFLLFVVKLKWQCVLVKIEGFEKQEHKCNPALCLLLATLRKTLLHYVPLLFVQALGPY